MGVNSNTFRRFMNPKTYKNQWSTTSNGCYWAAARLLAEDKWNKEQAKKAGKGKKKAAVAAGGKRKAAGGAENVGNAGASSATASAATKPSPKKSKADAVALMAKINATDAVITPVYDSCPELVKKVKEFLAEPGVTKSDFLAALGGINSNSLNRFLSAKQQDQCGNVAYPRAYAFFERKRILEGKKKTARRVKNEAEHPHGFSLEKERAGKWVITAAGW